jgi:hypothetical protein
MSTLWARVLELRTDEKHGRMNKLKLFAETRSTKAIRLDVEGDTFLTGQGFWSFRVPSQANEYLSIALKKTYLFHKDKIIGRTHLPLDWFPTNRIVREWFPMTAENDGDGPEAKTMICLDIHIDTRGARKFKAAFSNLRVIPTWIRPLEMVTDGPAPPQVIYVIPEDPNSDPPKFIPVGTAQYPSVEMFQADGPSNNSITNRQRSMTLPAQRTDPVYTPLDEVSPTDIPPIHE